MALRLMHFPKSFAIRRPYANLGGPAANPPQRGGLRAGPIAQPDSGKEDQNGSVPAAMSQNAGIQRPTKTHVMSDQARPFAGNFP